MTDCLRSLAILAALAHTAIHRRGGLTGSACRGAAVPPRFTHSSGAAGGVPCSLGNTSRHHYPRRRRFVRGPAMC